MSAAVTATDWDQAAAQAAYRAAAQRVAAWWDTQDCFTKPSLHRRDIVRADRAIRTAWVAQDLAALRVALAAWERAITGDALGAAPCAASGAGRGAE